MLPSEESIREKLEDVVDANIGKGLASSGAIRHLSIDHKRGEVSLHIRVNYPASGYIAELKSEVVKLLQHAYADCKFRVDVDWKILSHSVQGNLKPMKNVRNIIAVASGKGGVGKSTVAVNLALALRADGASVGLLDADIYGPSQPTMLGIRQRPDSADGKTLEPVEKFGLQTMSIGFLIEEGTPMIWRGPMVTQALEQMLHSTNWREMDYLVVDLPPGTGDTHLTLAQKIPVSGAVIVTTPQEIALLDARKGVKMFQKVNIPVLGVIENMSVYVCPHCGKEEAIFGSGGGENMAREFAVPFLGGLPLDVSIREGSDKAAPAVVADNASAVARRFKEIARGMAAVLATKSRDYSAKFPKIVVKND